MYKIARERIFGSSEDNVAGMVSTSSISGTQLTCLEDDADNGVSRTSSTSAKDKSNLGKRGKTARQRRDDSDSFDSRNQYTPYWGPQQQQTWMPQPPHMAQPNPQFNTQIPPPAYQGQMGPVYGQQGPGYQVMPNMVPNQTYPQYTTPPVRALYAFIQVGIVLTTLSCSTRPSQFNKAIPQTMVQCQHTVRRLPQLRSSKIGNSLTIPPHTNLSNPEALRVMLLDIWEYPTHLANFLQISILTIRKANIPSQGATIEITPSTL